MKIPVHLCAALSLILILANSALAAPLQVTVSIVPQKYFVEKIGGDLVDVNIMVRPGSSPATYEPQPKQMAQLSKADVYYAIGVPFERAWLPRFKSANSKLDIIDLSKSVALIPMVAHVHHDEDEEHHKHHDEGPVSPGESDHDDCEHDHHGNFLADPHIWLSPSLVRILAMDIRDTLIEKDPANEKTYMANYFRFTEEINSLDKKLLQLFADNPEKTRFMVYHPSWGYFAKSYGLQQIPIEMEGKEPSPRELGELTNFARQNSVEAIFIQPQFSRKSAEAIASSIGAKVLVADPLAEDWAANLEKAAKAFLNDAR